MLKSQLVNGNGVGDRWGCRQGRCVMRRRRGGDPVRRVSGLEHWEEREGFTAWYVCFDRLFALVFALKVESSGEKQRDSERDVDWIVHGFRSADYAGFGQ